MIKKHSIIISLLALLLFAVLLGKELLFIYRAGSISFGQVAQRELEHSAAELSNILEREREAAGSIIAGLNTDPSIDEELLQTNMSDVFKRRSLNGMFVVVENDNRPEQNTALYLSDKLEFERYTGFFNETAGRYRRLYEQTQARGKAWWISPDSLPNRGFVACCIPFRLENGLHGMVMQFYRTIRLYNYVQRLSFSRYGMVYVIDSTARCLAHPLDDIRTLGEIGRSHNDPALIRVEEDLVRRKQPKGPYAHRNTITGKMCTEIYASIPETGWLLGLSVYNGHALESNAYQWQMKRCIIRAIIWTTLLLIVLFAVFPFFGKSRYSRYFFPTLFLSAIIGVIITYYHRYPVSSVVKHPVDTYNRYGQAAIDEAKQRFLDNNRIYHKWDPQMVMDNTCLNKFLEHYSNQSRNLYSEDIKLLPTGIYLHDIQFEGAYTVGIRGYVWQKFIAADVPQPEEIQKKYLDETYENKGVFFPGAAVECYDLVDSTATLLENCKAVLMRWTFDIKLPQQMFYRLYPFEKSEITLPLWAVDLDDNTVMAPDLEGYQQLYPDICPGLGNRLSINGWDIFNSYFSYRTESYLSNFGNMMILGINDFPELEFKINVSPKFIDILVCRLIPLLVVWILLYTLLFVREEDDGFNNVIGCSGLFFVLIFDHINLRGTINSNEIMFLEYFYFFSYLLLLLVTVTSFRIDTDSRTINFLQRKEHLLKNYFWSVITGFMAITTAITFY